MAKKLLAIAAVIAGVLLFKGKAKASEDIPLPPGVDPDIILDPPEVTIPVPPEIVFEPPPGSIILKPVSFSGFWSKGEIVFVSVTGGGYFATTTLSLVFNLPYNISSIESAFFLYDSTGVSGSYVSGPKISINQAKFPVPNVKGEASLDITVLVRDAIDQGNTIRVHITPDMDRIILARSGMVSESNYTVGFKSAAFALEITPN